MSAPQSSDSESTASAKAVDPTPTPSLFSSSRAPKHNIHSVMNFEQLLKKVEQAEDALESREREVVADWHRLQATWRAAWTPGRILIAGVTSGFAFGRASRGSRGGGGSGFLRILSTVSGLIASANAQLAAHEAEHVAERVDAATAGYGHDDYDDYNGPDEPVPDADAHARRFADAPFDEGLRDGAALSPDEAVRRAGAESARP